MVPLLASTAVSPYCKGSNAYWLTLPFSKLELSSRQIHLIDCFKIMDVATVTSPIGLWTTILTPLVQHFIRMRGWSCGGARGGYDSLAPFTPPVQGGNIVSLCCLAVLYMSHGGNRVVSPLSCNRS